MPSRRRSGRFLGECEWVRARRRSPLHAQPTREALQLRRVPHGPARSHSARRGFTLIELVGVLAIIAMLAAVVTPNIAWRAS